MDVFDCMNYLRKLREFAQDSEDKIITYCLMPNHYHILIQARSPNSIPKLMQRLNTYYTRAFNEKYKKVGHLFQGRYHAKYINTTRYLLNVSRYIHRNPLELPGTNYKNILDYKWSGLKDLCELSHRSFIKLYPEKIMRHYKYSQKYLEYCLSSDKKAERWEAGLGLGFNP